MNLKTSIPQGADVNEIIFALPFDVSHKSGKRTENGGSVTVTRKEIRIYEKDKLIHEYRIDDFSEYEVVLMTGCSIFRGKYLDGEYITFAAFSQTLFYKFSELAKILDYYVSTGKFIERTDSPDFTCPGCGAFLGGNQSCVFCQKKSQIFIRLFKRIAPFKKYFILSFAASIILYGFAIIAPMIQRVIIDDLIVPKNQDWEVFRFLTGTLVLMGVVEMGLFYLTYFVNTKMSSLFGYNLRKEIFDKTQCLSTASINRRTSGELISRISGDAHVLQNFVTREGRDMIFQVISLISLAVIMFVTNWKLALIVVVPLPFVFAISVKIYSVVWLRIGRVWRFQCWAANLLHDVIQGVRVIKNYGTEKREIDAYDKASQKWAKSVGHSERFWNLTTPPLRYIISLGEFAALYFGAKMVLGDEIKLGEMVQFMSYIYMLYGPIQWLVRLPRTLAQTSVSAGKIFEVLDEETDVNDKEDAKELVIKGDICFENVFFGYKAYNPVLKNISCDIKAGEMIGIVGHSGVGKSTFINLVMRLYDTTDGTIKIDGVDIKSITQNSLRSQVGVVLQETFLFNDTVYENIRYAKPEASFEEIIQAAKIANCHDFIVRLPDGYNTRVGERGYSISGGERQRIAIARAILHNPRIIILDEATASLDTQTEKQIQTALARLIEGRTTIAIAHRLSTLSGANKLIVLDKGRVAEIGSHNELMAKGGVYFGLVMAQRQTARIKK